MSIESSLTRVLDIRFIDARKLTSEAKLNLEIVGYPDKQQQATIIKEAIRLFVKQPESDQNDMKLQKQSLDSLVTSRCYPDDSTATGPSTSSHTQAWESSAKMPKTSLRGENKSSKYIGHRTESTTTASFDSGPVDEVVLKAECCVIQ